MKLNEAEFSCALDTLGTGIARSIGLLTLPAGGAVMLKLRSAFIAISVRVEFLRVRSITSRQSVCVEVAQ